MATSSNLDLMSKNKGELTVSETEKKENSTTPDSTADNTASESNAAETNKTETTETKPTASESKAADSKTDDAKTSDAKAEPTAAEKNAENQVQQKQPKRQTTTHLSKKNEDYLYRLRKLLIAGGKTNDEEAEIIDKLTPEILEAQRGGKTANQLYGAPTVKAEAILHAPKPAKKIPYWQVGVDNTLLFFSLFAAFYGLMAMFSKQNQEATTGILSLIVISIGVGAMMGYSYYINQRESKPPLWKSLLWIVLFILVMFILIGVTSIIPAMVNPHIPGIAYLILAALAFGGRWLFRRHYGISGRLM